MAANVLPRTTHPPPRENSRRTRSWPLCLAGVLLSRSLDLGLQLRLAVPGCWLRVAWVAAWPVRSLFWHDDGILAILVSQFPTVSARASPAIPSRRWPSRGHLRRVSSSSPAGGFIVAADGSPRIDDPRSAVLFSDVDPRGGRRSSRASPTLACRDRRHGDWPRQLRPAASATSGFAICLGFHRRGPVSGRQFFIPSADAMGFIAQRKQPLCRVRGLWREDIELTGLTLGNLLLSIIQVLLHVELGNTAWPLWGMSLLARGVEQPSPSSAAGP